MKKYNIKKTEIKKRKKQTKAWEKNHDKLMKKNSTIKTNQKPTGIKRLKLWKSRDEKIMTIMAKEIKKNGS